MTPTQSRIARPESRGHAEAGRRSMRVLDQPALGKVRCACVCSPFYSARHVRRRRQDRRSSLPLVGLGRCHACVNRQTGGSAFFFSMREIAYVFFFRMESHMFFFLRKWNRICLSESMRCIRTGSARPNRPRKLVPSRTGPKGPRGPLGLTLLPPGTPFCSHSPSRAAMLPLSKIAISPSKYA